MGDPAYLADLLRRVPERPDRSRLHLHLGDWSGDPGGMLQAQAALADRVIAALGAADGMRVLDAGCGIGGSLAVLDARLRGLELVGLNIGPAQLAVAERAVRPSPTNEIRWVLGDACDMPFERASFDRILCLEAMFHFPSRARFFAEAARVLVPGGRLAGTDLRILPSAPDDLAALVTADLAPWPDPPGTEGSLRDLAEAAGLSAVREEDWTEAILPSFRAMLGPAALAEPARVADRGDRGTAALGRLGELGLLRVDAFVYKT